MSRPQKQRKVCTLPVSTKFEPQNTCGKNSLNMTIDEYESIRLIDFEGLTQQECAQQMEVARTTVQAIYASARKTLAACIVNGHSLTIGGGEYKVCEHRNRSCGCGCCCRRCRNKTNLTEKLEKKTNE